MHAISRTIKYWLRFILLNQIYFRDQSMLVYKIPMNYITYVQHCACPRIAVTPSQYSQKWDHSTSLTQNLTGLVVFYPLFYYKFSVTTAGDHTVLDRAHKYPRRGKEITRTQPSVLQIKWSQSAFYLRKSRMQGDAPCCKYKYIAIRLGYDVP